MHQKINPILKLAISNTHASASMLVLRAHFNLRTVKQRHTHQPCGCVNAQRLMQYRCVFLEQQYRCSTSFCPCVVDSVDV